MRESANEILYILNDLFFLKLIEVVGIDDDDLLFSSEEYGISWNIMTQNVKVYYYGKQVSSLCKLNIENELSEINKVQYEELMINLISITTNDIIDEISKALQKYIVFERYEDAQKLKNFLDLFN